MTESKNASTQRFALVFIAFFLIIGLWPQVLHHEPVRNWGLLLALVITLLAFTAPGVLRPFEMAWQKLGFLLHFVTNPLLMALIYWFAFMPMAIGLKLLGKQLLPLKWEPDLDSYWIRRAVPGIAPGSMLRQF